MRIFFTRNGAITNSSREGGDEAFCNYVTSAINGMDRLPVPPSDAVYNTMNGATLNLKPNTNGISAISCTHCLHLGEDAYPSGAATMDGRSAMRY